MLIKYLLILSLLFSCNVAEIAGVAETDLGDNFRFGYDGLIHYYRFESVSAGSTRYDDIGNADLTDYTNTSGNTGVYGNAIDCSTATSPGGNGVLTHQGINVGVTGSSDHTISFWIYPYSLILGGLFEYGPISINMTAAGAFEISLDNDVTSATTSYIVSTSTWTHISFVIRGGLVDFFANGVYQESHNPATSPGTATAIYTCYSSGVAAKLDGRLDSFGIFNRALNSTEVSDIYNNTNGLD
jgi:hypothetical protein